MLVAHNSSQLVTTPLRICTICIYLPSSWRPSFLNASANLNANSIAGFLTETDRNKCPESSWIISILFKAWLFGRTKQEMRWNAIAWPWGLQPISIASETCSLLFFVFLMILCISLSSLHFFAHESFRPHPGVPKDSTLSSNRRESWMASVTELLVISRNRCFIVLISW